MPTEIEITDWYKNKQPIYESLGEVSSATLSALLRVRGIDFLSVTYRTKSLESVIEKVTRKDYEDLSDITDLAGIRIISYIESDIRKVSELVKEAFSIDEKNSIDKSQELSADRFGYRSVHFVCELGEERLTLPELKPFENLKFEVQIRTVLQHAWAEIEHDRSYKFSGELPSSIKRRLNLLAGVLELADREFALLAAEVDQYAQRIENSAKDGSLDAEELTSISLLQFLRSTADFSSIATTRGEKSLKLDTVIGELKNFGISNIEGVKELLSPEFTAAVKRHAPSGTVIVFLRRAMIFKDMEHYFSRAWDSNWRRMGQETFALACSKIGEAEVQAILDKYGVRLSKPSTPKKAD
jgi:ppGpp synthetase/RelA/SpoT-type nucleotidyltranferase